MQFDGFDNYENYYFGGGLKKARDLEFIFDIKFVQIYENNYFNGKVQGNAFWILESEQNILCQNIISALNLEYGKNYCFDEDVFEYLNKRLAYEYTTNPVAIWGIGQVSKNFVETFDKVSLKDRIKYYVCTNKLKEYENDIPIILPEELVNLDCKIIIAVNHQNYYEIEQKCKELGIPKERYIYYAALLDNPGDFLKETYYDKNYYATSCINKDQTIRVNRRGCVGTCCFSINRNIMGNIYEQDFEDIWTSLRAKICRLALINHTYTFCDHFRCPFLRGVDSDKTSADYSKTYEYETTQHPISIAPEVDFGCNLYCTSCREAIFYDTDIKNEFWCKIIKNKLANAQSDMIINTVGEPLASKWCLELFEDLCDSQHEHIALYSNGTLLNDNKLDELINKYGKVKVAISVDAATEETYKKIRRGGNYNKLISNLEYVAQKRKEGKIAYWRLNYVIQSTNVNEIRLFVSTAEQLGVDEIYFHEIENWGMYTSDEYENIKITEGNQIKCEYRTFFSGDLVNNPRIIWGNLTHILGCENKFIRLI